MRKLIEGVYKFRTEVYPERKELFAKLSSEQHPRILFITCSDSRIDPSLVTSAPPGDLFIVRNAGNIVPPHVHDAGGTTASIEFAVGALKVPHVVICGHTDCGAIKAAIHPEHTLGLPHMRDWLSHTEASVAVVKARNGKVGDENLAELTEVNVVQQMRNLFTHPTVAAAVAVGDLQVHGWIYNIGTGEIRCYDRHDHGWHPVEEVYREQEELARAIERGVIDSRHDY